MPCRTSYSLIDIQSSSEASKQFKLWGCCATMPGQTNSQDRVKVFIADAEGTHNYPEPGDLTVKQVKHWIRIGNLCGFPIDYIRTVPHQEFYDSVQESQRSNISSTISIMDITRLSTLNWHVIEYKRQDCVSQPHLLGTHTFMRYLWHQNFTTLVKDVITLKGQFYHQLSYAQCLYIAHYLPQANNYAPTRGSMCLHNSCYVPMTYYNPTQMIERYKSGVGVFAAQTGNAIDSCEKYAKKLQAFISKEKLTLSQLTNAPYMGIQQVVKAGNLKQIKEIFK